MRRFRLGSELVERVFFRPGLPLTSPCFFGEGAGVAVGADGNTFGDEMDNTRDGCTSLLFEETRRLRSFLGCCDDVDGCCCCCICLKRANGLPSTAFVRGLVTMAAFSVGVVAAVAEAAVRPPADPPLLVFITNLRPDFRSAVRSGAETSEKAKGLGGGKWGGGGGAIFVEGGQSSKSYTDSFASIAGLEGVGFVGCFIASIMAARVGRVEMNPPMEGSTRRFRPFLDTPVSELVADLRPGGSDCVLLLAPMGVLLLPPTPMLPVLVRRWLRTSELLEDLG